MRVRPIAVALAAALAIGAGAWWALTSADRGADPSAADGAAMVRLGERVYRDNCAACHGASGQGQENWRRRKADGRLPAPPLNGTGHAWHHPDGQLYAMISRGIEALAPAGYRSDMAGFGGTLTDGEIGAVIAYIKDWWPDDIRAHQQSITERSASSR